MLRHERKRALCGASLSPRVSQKSNQQSAVSHQLKQKADS
jgi:hypothetical protein